MEYETILEISLGALRQVLISDTEEDPQDYFRNVQMAEYRHGRLSFDVYRWSMPEFRVQLFHIASKYAKERPVSFRQQWYSILWTIIAVDKVDLLLGDSNQAGQYIKWDATFCDYNNSILVQCIEAILNHINDS